MQEQAALASSVFMSRQSRELRSRHRSSARSMTAEEREVIADAKKKQQVQHYPHVHTHVHA
jgi:hypothetical protein